MNRGQMNRPISGPRRGCPEMGSRAAAPTASRPFPFKKTTGFWGVGQSGEYRLVVHPAKRGGLGELLRGDRLGKLDKTESIDKRIKDVLKG